MYLILLFVELIDDDTDEQVEREEGTEHDEEDEVEIHVDGVLTVRLLVQLNTQTIISRIFRVKIADFWSCLKLRIFGVV